MSSKLRHIFILANILWVVIIFILCAMPSDDIPDPHWNIPHLDKVVHFGMYFVLSILLIFPLEEYSCLKLSRIYLIAILVALIYGGGIEILQANFFNRSGDVWDLVADVSGRLSVLSYCKKIHPHEKLNSILNFNFQFLILN